MYNTGYRFNIKTPSYQYRKSHGRIRRSYDRLVSRMGFPIQIRLLYCESGPWWLAGKRMHIKLATSGRHLHSVITLPVDAILVSHYYWRTVTFYEAETILKHDSPLKMQVIWTDKELRSNNGKLNLFLLNKWCISFLLEFNALHADPF